MDPNYGWLLGKYPRFYGPEKDFLQSYIPWKVLEKQNPAYFYSNATVDPDVNT